MNTKALKLLITSIFTLLSYIIIPQFALAQINTTAKPTISSSTAIPPILGQAKVDPVKQAQIQGNYGKLPLLFEANAGQTDAQVKFIHRSAGQTLYLTQQGAVFSLAHKQNPAEAKASGANKIEASKIDKVENVRMRLLGSNSNPKVTSVDEQITKTNYFIGNDPSKWRTNVSNFAKVKYQAVYPGIDLLYYGNESQLEYDLIVAPKGNPKQIRLTFDGAKSLSINDAGELVIKTELGEIVQHKPVIYQMIDGQKHFVEGAFLRKDAHTIGFDVAQYDTAHELVIDPSVSLAYSTYLRGSGSDQGFGIAVDSSGNAYVTGVADSTDFPTTPGAFQATFGGNVDVFVSKLNASGTALIYSTYLGGSDADFGYGIAADSSGNTYVTGFTNSPNFPTTLGAFQTTYKGLDCFISKLNATGTALIYSTFLGGTGVDYGNGIVSYGFGIAIDSNDNAYITGFTQALDFPTTPGAFQTTLSGGQDVFVSKLNATGTALIYSTFLGGTGIDEGTGIAVDSGGNAYITGFTSSDDFPTTPGAFQTTFPGSAGVSKNVFVSKLNATGAALVYSTYLGGTDNDEGVGIAVDSSGNAYVTGGTGSANFPTTPGAFQTTYEGNGDGFVTKLNANGTLLVYSTYLGSSGDGFGAGGRGVAIDSNGNAYITGETNGNFPTTIGAFQTTVGGSFITKLNSDGTTLLYSTYLGGSNGDIGNAIAVDSSGNAYVTGFTNSPNFPTTPGAFQAIYAGSQDAFASKLTTTPTIIASFSPTSGTIGASVNIVGANFTGATIVRFNGVSTTFSIVSETSINATVPTGATTGQISVTTPLGTATSTNSFTVTFPPTITSFLPISGTVGTSVTITGANFTGATSVSFNGASATFSVVSDTAITTTVPTGATTGAISVTTPLSTATSTNNFGVSPTITNFSPTSGTVGTSVTITGASFTGTTTVNFNGVSTTFNVVSDTSLTAIVPTGATTGMISITTLVGTATSTNSFTVNFPPTITSFSPTSGIIGTAVTITGANFTGATAVKFNNVASTFSVTSDTSITTTVPTGATTGQIHVTTPIATAISNNNFTVTFPPTITSFSPTSGAVGTNVTITGANFTGATSVRFNGVNATFNVGSDTAITTTVPNGAMTGMVSVTTPIGTATSTNNFAVSPSINSFFPTSGMVGTSVTILGANFTGATAVKFNGVSATFTVASDTAINTTVPTGATGGLISVTTPTGTTTSTMSFSFAPKITSFSPTSGSIGVGILLTGSGFTGTTIVKFNTTNATFTVMSDTQIVAIVPTGATTGKITVTNPAGSVTTTTNFTLTTGSNKPTITSFTPTSGMIGTTVTINGNNYIGATSVKFNTTNSINFTVVSATMIKADVPLGATTGKISVTTAAGTVASTTNFTVLSSVPTISSFSPTSGIAGTKVTINGTNFSAAVVVRFNGIKASISSITATSMSVLVPVGAISGKITVSNAFGMATSAGTFTISGACTVTPITLGQTINGALATTDCPSVTRGSTYLADSYTFTGIAGQQLNILLTSTAFDTYIYLIGSDGKVLIENDDGSGVSNSQIPSTGGFFTLPTSGSYTIEVTSFNPGAIGNYSLVLTPAP